MIAVQGYTRVWLRFKHWPEQAYSFFKRLFPRAKHSARHGQRATRAGHISVSLLQEWRALRTLPPQTLGGSFSAVSKPNFASKYALELWSIWKEDWEKGDDWKKKIWLKERS